MEDRSVTGKQGIAGNCREGKKICLSREGEKSLPDEIISEILSWLPVKFALRCKCVCKLWHTMIQDRIFIEKHMQRSTLETVYMDGSKKTFKWLYRVNGLVLETSNLAAGKYRVRNPATKQVLELPDPEEQHKIMTLSFVSSTNEYKLVYIHNKKGTIDLGMKVLTAGTDLTWRLLDIPLSYASEREKISTIHFNGVFYIIKFCEGELEKTEIVGFHLGDESFMEIKIPDGFFSGMKRFNGFVWDDKLSLGCTTEEEINVWVLEDYKEQKWCERKIIIPLEFMNEHRDVSENLVPYSASGNRLWITANSKDDLSYDIESRRVEFVRSAPPGKKLLYHIKPSLVFLQGMKPEE